MSHLESETTKKAQAGKVPVAEVGVNTFIFFSELQNRQMVDSTGQPVGRVDDLKTKLDELFPRITTLVIKRGRLSRPQSLDWSEVAIFCQDKITLKPGAEKKFAPLEVSNEEILLKADLLDKQVVDTYGAKIERVNDIHLLVVNHDLRIVHVDFGIRGILRRLGWLRRADALTDWLFTYRFQEKLVSWKYVQPLAADPKHNLKLNLTLRKLHEIHPSDLADILEDLNQANRSSIFKALDLETAADTLQEVDPKIQVSLIETTPQERASDILEEMEPDEARDFLAELPEEKKDALMRTMEEPYRENVEELLQYKGGTAGGIMTKDFIALRQEATIAQAIDAFSRVFFPMESVAYIYVTDKGEHLIGVITLRHLLTCDRQRTLGQLMNVHLVKVDIEDNLDKVADFFKKYKFMALPVVDQDNVIQGIITLQDILIDEPK
jgi:CBS domain-containing protein